MANIIKPKLSASISEQLPEFIQSDYNKFVKFLEAYYEFIEQEETRNLEKIRDLDYTLDTFVLKLKNELDYIGKNYSNIDERFLLQHIKDIYLAKGSEASYKLMFKLLFNKEATIKYPGQYLFKPSDGKWKQEVSVLVSTVSGDIFSIVGKEVVFVINAKKYKFLISRVKQTEFEGVKEVFIESQIFTDIPIGTSLQYGTFTGLVEPTITSVAVTYGGLGFKLGQIYEIVTENGYGTKIKIVAVTPTGEVQKIQIVKYGYGYQTNAIITIAPQNSANSNKVPFLNGTVLEVSDNIDSYKDYGFLAKYDYAEADYMDNTYVGAVLQEFYNSSDNNNIKSDGSDLLIKFTLGGKIKYPGFYETNDGFVSDTIYLQDSRYYQIYSYVISIEEQLKNYKDYIQTYLHPAGMKMFAEYNITNTLSVKASLKFVLNLLKFILAETITTSESRYMDVIKNLEDNFSTSDIAALIYFKNLLVDSITSNDEVSIATTKGILDNINLDDSTFTYNFAYARELIDTFSFSENLNFQVSKVLSDTYSMTDSQAKAFGKNIGTIVNLNNSGALGDEYANLGMFQLGAPGNAFFGAENPEDYVTLDDSMFSLMKQAWQLFDDSFSTTEGFTTQISKGLVDSITPTEVRNGYTFEKYLSDIINNNDSINLSLTKYINNDTVIVDDIDNIMNISYNAGTSSWSIYFGPPIDIFNSTGLLGSNFARLGAIMPGSI